MLTSPKLEKLNRQMAAEKERGQQLMAVAETPGDHQATWPAEWEAHCDREVDLREAIWAEERRLWAESMRQHEREMRLRTQYP